MSKWIAEFELEDGDTMPEHMDLEYKGVKIDFHCRPLSSSEKLNKSEIPTGTPNIISFKEMTDNLEITADDIENAEDLEYSIEPLVHPKNDLGVDCISRAEVLKLMQDNWHTHSGDWAMEESMDDIRALPSVKPQEPKTGHWIFKKTAFDKFGNTVECSSCHKKWKTYDEVRWRKENKYCPNCGAEMEEVRE